MKPMNRWLNRGWTSLGLLGIVGLASTGHGCASTDEGDYIDPPGFAPQHTQAVALGVGSFVRDGDNGLMTTGLATQRLRDASGRPASGPGDKGRLGAIFHGSYADGMTVSPASQPRASLRVVPVQAQASAPRLRYDGAVVAFEEAFPHVTSAFGARDSRVEEFLVIPDEKDVPVLAYDLIPGPDFDRIEPDESDASLWAYAQDGDGVFSILPPSADDAAGKHVEGSWKLEKTSTGYRITAQIDLHGLAYPVLLDPTFETPLWFSNTSSQPTAGAGIAAAFDINSKCTVLFGGSHDPTTFTPNQETSLRCADRRWKANIPITGPKPPARTYAAMGYFGGSTNKVFLFGGNGTDANLGDLWAFTPVCTTPGVTSTCSGSWAQITPSGASPSGRFYHAMAWNGSSLMLFGGANGEGGLRDTWMYNADTNTWTDANASFGGSTGLLGFAAATAIRGNTRTVYAIGGYTGTQVGAFSNAVYRWDGDANEWLTPSTAGQVIPLVTDAAGNTTGALDSTSTALETPMPPRFFHWAASTSNGHVLVGGGLTTGGTVDAPTYNMFTDSWLRLDQDSVGLNQWLQQPRPRRDNQGPGERESAAAVYDENLKELVLFGGLTTNETVMVAKGQVYRGVERTFNLIQSCSNAACTNLYTTAVVPGVNASECANFNVQFVRKSTTTWANVGGTVPVDSAVPNGAAAFTFGVHPGPNFPGIGSVCYARSVNLGAGRADYGARLRDNRYHLNGSDCLLVADEVTTSNARGACITAGSSYVGSASCGGQLVDDGFLSDFCLNY